MFSVPGWNVSAPLTPQIEKEKPKNASSEGKKSKNSKKRKRQEEEQVNEGNLDTLWNKVAEGGPAVTSQKEAFAAAKEAERKANAPPPERQHKKRHRSKAKKNAAAAEDKIPVENPTETEQEDATAGSEQPISTPEPAAPTTDVGTSITATTTADVPPTTTDKISKDAEQAKRDKKKRKQENRAVKAALKASAEPPKVPTPTKLVPAVSLIPEPPGLTPMQRSMRTKLASARFRHLNESLYTKPSKESLEIFKETPSMFEDYHRGFAQQVEVWPENPVDGYVSNIIARGKLRTKDPWKDKKRALTKKGAQPPTEDSAPPAPSSTGIKPLPRNLKGVTTIADLGCGTASLSHTLQPHLKSLNLVLHSFDLARPTGPSGPLVTVADISALPLPDSSVDVAIFCLALMGTNWLDFVDEAWRVLRWRGELWIAEIKSRFGRVGSKSAPGRPPPNSVGLNRKPDKKAAKPKKNAGEIAEGAQNSDDETELAERVDGQEGKEGTDVSAFVEVLRKHGFVLDALPEKAHEAVDLSNKMFVKMHFVKAAPPSSGKNKKEATERPAAKTDMRMSHGMKGKKYGIVAEVDDEKSDEKDSKVLKPCLYKIR